METKLDTLEGLIHSRKLELEKLSDEKEKILDWVHAQEKKVDGLKEEENKIRENTQKELQALTAKKAEVLELVNESNKKIDAIRKFESKILQEQSALDDLIKKESDFNKSLNARKLELDEREGEIFKREAFVKDLFSKIDSLKF